MAERFRQSMPSAITLLSVVLGVDAARRLIDGAPDAHTLAAVEIFAAGVCDILDGRLARLMKAQSTFGGELDSLADAIAFGVAPALLAYDFVLREVALGPFPLGLILALTYVAAGVARLARFNATSHGEDEVSERFSGLAIPLGAGLIAGTVLVAGDAPGDALRSPVLWVVGVPAISLLMVTSVPYPSFKRLPSDPVTLGILLSISALSLLLAALVRVPVGALGLVAGYVLLGPLVVLQRPHRSAPAKRDTSGESG